MCRGRRFSLTMPGSGVYIIAVSFFSWTRCVAASDSFQVFDTSDSTTMLSSSYAVNEWGIVDTITTLANLSTRGDLVAGDHDGISPVPHAPNIAQQASLLPLFQIGTMFTTCTTPILASVGFVGNTLSLFVMIQPHNRRISCCVYMAALAVSDNMMLLVAAYHWAISNMQIRGGRFYLKECMVHEYMLMSFSFLGVVFIVSMTFDRFLAVRFPFKAATWCSTKRAKITIIVDILAVFIYNIPYALYTGVVKDGRQCDALTVKTQFTMIYGWLTVCLNSIVPFTVLLILNVLIISTVRNRGKYFKDQGGAGGGASAEEKARDRQLIIMLMLVSFAVLFLTAPQYARLIYYTFVDFTSNPITYAEYVLAVNITTKLLVANNAVNFFLYCMGGSKFRQDLAALFPCCSGRETAQPGKGHSTSTLATSTSTISEK